ncbi:MAG TPA: ABC transporter ATP-binding protein [Candidatus Limnocylindrales bacterium]|nr:ABC transporter ATP-binding protein [Candidatus Limnocylindrales bacterium]
MTPLLQVRNLHATFLTARGPVTAVNSVSLDLDSGQTLAIVGESGSGKTVLARAIMGLDLGKPGRIDSGEVWLDGLDMRSLPPAQLRGVWGRRVSMVFQDPMTALNPVLTIGRQLTEHLVYRGTISRRQAEEVAIDLLRRVGVPDPARRRRQYPHELSGGLRQRVVIALAIAGQPQLLLADEPTTALDVTVQAQILNLLADAQQELGMAMILVSHDLGVVRGRADQVAVMYAGRIVERAPARRIFSTPRMPYTEALLRARPDPARPIHSRLEVIPGGTPDLATRGLGCPFAPRCSYAQDRCRVEAPALTRDESGSEYACWFPVPEDKPLPENLIRQRGVS